MGTMINTTRSAFLSLTRASSLAALMVTTGVSTSISAGSAHAASHAAPAPVFLSNSVFLSNPVFLSNSGTGHRIEDSKKATDGIGLPFAKPDDLLPNTVYDAKVPTHKSVLGYAIGDRITTHADMVRYFEALAAFAPDRVKLFDYGETWEGRKLVYAVITAADNLARLDEIKQNTRALADPRGLTPAEAEAIIAKTPASTWLAYSVHGNEISGTDAAMRTAYHLLAAENDPRVDAIMNETLVFINPLQNPDGRDRFIHRYRTALGMAADSDPISAEHNEPWPNGRTNHYLFDMNRDWIVLTQPETQGHIDALQEWYPQVFVDLHEMGGNSHYYFAPEAVPFNPHLTGDQRDSLTWFGRTNAKNFDTLGMRYFTRDIFDAFYPGYGASWPAYYGAISMTYEQGSSRGLLFRRNDGSEFTYLDSIRGHFITSLGTAETAATKRSDILKNFYAYQVSAIAEGQDRRNGPRAYLFPDAGKTYAGRKLMAVLDAQGIEVQWLKGAQNICGGRFGEGTAYINSAQPRKRMIRTLLDPQVDMTASFVKEQERRRAKNLPHDIYDVTAWSLPKMFNVTMESCRDAVSTPTTTAPTGDVAIAEDAVVYVMDGEQGGLPQAMAHAFRMGMTPYMHHEGFTASGDQFGRGSLFFYAKDIKDTADLQKLATVTGNKIVPLNDTWVDSGRDLGGRAVTRLIAPKIAMAWEEGTSQYSAGNSRFVIERQFGYPVSVIRTRNLRGADLSRYDVLVLPVGFYGQALGDAGRSAISDWVRRGGVVIAQGEATRYLTSGKSPMLALQREAQAKDPKKAKARGKTESGLTAPTLLEDEEAYRAFIEPKTESPDNIPGVLLNASTDQDHWLSSGAKPDQVALYRGRDVYTPLKLNEGRNIARFKAGDALLSSGYLWEEAKPLLANKPLMVMQSHGRGMVIAFTQDPTVRAYLNGLQTLYGNALFVAPSRTRKIR